MTEKLDSKMMLHGVGNDLKILIDDVIGTIIDLQEDVSKLKFKASKPSKAKAMALLEYLSMEDGKTKQNIESLCGDEIKLCLQWIDKYCEDNDCTQEEALNEIIDSD